MRLIVSGATLLLLACQTIAPAPPRVLRLGDVTWDEKTQGGVEAWGCDDPEQPGGRVIVEVGRFPGGDLSEVGFILFDGSSEGELTSFHREGLDLRWDWGPNGNEYAFVIDADRTGRSYDFTLGPAGELKSPRDWFRCRKRRRTLG